MRTTLSLDDDVAALVERARREKGLALKDVVNEALRRGLRLMDAPEPERPRYTTRSADLGRCLVPDLDDVSDALAAAEGEGYR